MTICRRRVFELLQMKGETSCASSEEGCWYPYKRVPGVGWGMVLEFLHMAYPVGKTHTNTHRINQVERLWHSLLSESTPESEASAEGIVFLFGSRKNRAYVCVLGRTSEVVHNPWRGERETGYPQCVWTRVDWRMFVNVGLQTANTTETARASYHLQHPINEPTWNKLTKAS